MRVFLLLLALLAPAQAADIKLATWNIAWLTLKPTGHPDLPREWRARSRVLPRTAHPQRVARARNAHGAWREASAHARRARARALALRAYLARARVGVSQTSGGGGRDGARGRTSNQWA
jgi:hypothetical protein